MKAKKTTIIGIVVASILSVAVGLYGIARYQEQAAVDLIERNVTCESSRDVIIVMMRIASEPYSEDEIAKLIDVRRKEDKISELEAHTGKKLLKYRANWESIPISTRQSSTGAIINDTTERDRIIWRYGKQICLDR